MRKNKSSEEKTTYYSKVRETFDQIRYQKNEGFSLKWQLSIIVTVGLGVGIWLGYAVSKLLNLFGLHLENIELFLVVTVVSLIFGFGFSLLVSKWVFKPIKDLQSAMEKVADGDFDVRLTNNYYSKEIQEVSTGFNLMVHEIGSTEMLRQDFTSTVSHEFKTPIAAIEGYSTLLQDGDNLNDDQREYVEKILYNTNRLSNLVGSILLLSKLENQMIETNQTLYLLDEQIRESLLAFETEWMNKNIEFDVDLDSIKYVGNEALVRHIWDNLIGNAIKFSPDGGLIKLRLTKEDDQIIFLIEDRGPGIPDDAKKRIFDKFYQHDKSRKQEGHGLGLALVKRIVTISGGSIGVEDAEGGGSRFIVTLDE